MVRSSKEVREPHVRLMTEGPARTGNDPGRRNRMVAPLWVAEESVVVESVA